MNRQEYNRKIHGIIGSLIEQYPDWRYTQILQFIGINKIDVTDGEPYIRDNFYEEPEVTLSKVKERLSELKNNLDERKK